MVSDGPVSTSAKVLMPSNVMDISQEPWWLAVLSRGSDDQRQTRVTRSFVNQMSRGT